MLSLHKLTKGMISQCSVNELLYFKPQKWLQEVVQKLKYLTRKSCFKNMVKNPITWSDIF